MRDPASAFLFSGVIAIRCAAQKMSSVEQSTWSLFAGRAVAFHREDENMVRHDQRDELACQRARWLSRYFDPLRTKRESKCRNGANEAGGGPSTVADTHP